MEYNKFIDEIFEKKLVYDANGKAYPLKSGISRKEGEVILNIVKNNQFKKTIEIGCAYGISSLYICSGSAGIYKSCHTIIDPFQKEWDYIGIENLKRAGLTSFELIEKLSEIALPQLLEKNEKFEFCFIDGWHTFDHVMIDFFYLNRLIDVGGVIVFHDVNMPSINKLLRYIFNYPSYEIIESVKFHQPKKTFNRKVKEVFISTPLNALSRMIPRKNVYEFFSGKLISKDENLHLDSTMVAIRKVKSDDRDWRWFKDF
jgi:predicted O-methyltransferase YrrM